MNDSELKERLGQIAQAFVGRGDLGFGELPDLENLFRNELGSLDVLDGWVDVGGSRVRARAPEKIYHVLASNLAVSAETSLLLGLILGGELIFKLPGVGLPEFEATVEKLPDHLKMRVRLRRSLDEEEMRSCEAVVVYGSDETVDFFRSRTGRNQRTLFYGNRISFGILERNAGDLLSWAAKAAEEVAAYDQGGCLSPQFYWAEDEGEAGQFAEYLAAALSEITGKKSGGNLSFEEASQRRHARRVLRGRGARLWETDAGGGFTVSLRAGTDFFVGPGSRFIQVGFGNELNGILKEWKGKISSISLATSSWPSSDCRWENLAASLGASRLCRMGDLQKPPLAWRHDGRPRLADLVTWISLDV